MSPLCSRNARSQKTLVGRAQWGTHPGHPKTTKTSKLGRIIFSHSLWPCVEEGASRRARVGRVRSLVFLSILREWFFVVAHVRILKVLACQKNFSATCWVPGADGVVRVPIQASRPGLNG